MHPLPPIRSLNGHAQRVAPVLQPSAAHADVSTLAGQADQPHAEPLRKRKPVVCWSVPLDFWPSEPCCQRQPVHCSLFAVAARSMSAEALCQTQACVEQLWCERWSH